MQRAPHDGPASLSESSSSPRRRALSLSSGSSKSDDRRDDRPAALSPEPADTSRRLWPHRGRVRSTRAAILTTDRLAATTAAATAAQRREPRSRDFASSLLPFNESAAERRPRSFIDCAVGAVRQFLDSPRRREPAGGHGNVLLKSNFFDPNQRTQDRISVSIAILETRATMTEELRVIIVIALGLTGVVGLWLSTLWVAGGFVLP